MKKFFKTLAVALSLATLASAAVACTKSDSSSNILTMATNAEFPPYEYYSNDKIIGIDADIAAAIADKLGMTLQINDMDFDSILPAVEAGKYDMAMAGLTVTDERKLEVNFTDSYATGVQVIIVPDNSPITSVDDHSTPGNNYRIGVQLSTTGDLYTTSDLEDNGLATIQRYNNGSDAIMALNSGKVDCVVIDNKPAQAFVAQNTGLKILDTAYTDEDYAIAVNKNETDLYNQINTALDALIADGTVQKIIDSYITSN